jgi:hypothetical protein
LLRLDSPAQRAAVRVGSPVTLVLSLALLLTAWVFTNPPGMAPDEPAHLTRVIGMAHGEWLGNPAQYAPQPAGLPELQPTQQDWLNRTARAVWVPAHMAACLDFRLPIYGRCPLGQEPPTPARELTYVGTYPPFPYLVPALAVRLAGDTTSALVLARAAVAVSAAFFLFLALALMWRRGSISLLGLSLAASPTVLFLDSQLQTSGLQATAAIALVTGLVALLGSESEPASALAWAAVLIGGAVLSIARAGGPEMLVIDVVATVALLGITAARRAIRRARGWAAATGVSWVLASVANLAWELAFDASPKLRLSVAREWLEPAIRELPHQANQTIAVFAWMIPPVSVYMPTIAYRLWEGVLVGLVLMALVLASWWRRLVLLLLLVAAAAGTVLVEILIIKQQSPLFDMQGRYVLPFTVVIPVLAAEVVHRGRERLPAWLRERGAVFLVTLTIAVGVWGCYVNARFYERNIGHYIDFSPRPWQPVLGWKAWMVVLAVSLLLAAAFGGVRAALGDGHWRRPAEVAPAEAR